MGGDKIQGHVPCSKGSVCYALDEFSIGQGARARVKNLSNAIKNLAPSYAGLAETFNKYLLPYVFTSAATRERIVDHLNAFWFDPKSPRAFFPGVPVARIYARGVLNALELSLNGKGPVVPFDAWWVLDAAEFSLLAFVKVEDGVTTSNTVALLIETPRPRFKASNPTSKKWILGDTAEAYVTRVERREVVTRRVRTL
jgi:hypothetical protein